MMTTFTNVLECLDITEPKLVEIVVRDDRKVIWINIDGVCRLRACRIEKLIVTDQKELNNSVAKLKEKKANVKHNQKRRSAE